MHSVTSEQRHLDDATTSSENHRNTTTPATHSQLEESKDVSNPEYQEEPLLTSFSKNLKFGVDRLLKEDISQPQQELKSYKHKSPPSSSPARSRDSSVRSLDGFHSCTHSRDLQNGPFPPSTSSKRKKDQPQQIQSELEGQSTHPCSASFHQAAAPHSMQDFFPFTSVLNDPIPLMAMKLPPLRAVMGQPQVPLMTSHAPSSRDVATTSNRRKRSWTRAVFSNLQRKGLEKRFLLQKYITKPDRRQLAATLGLTDSQVKVWFQNRRMKWRHSEMKKTKESSEGEIKGTKIVGHQISLVENHLEPVTSSQNPFFNSSEEESSDDIDSDDPHHEIKPEDKIDKKFSKSF